MQLKLDVVNYEKCYETMEGTARYVEYSLYKEFSTNLPSAKLLKSDKSFNSFGKFRNYRIENDAWLFLAEKSTNFYAVEFNMARLLDKLKVEYKSKLFKQGGLSLEEILINRRRK